MNINQAKYVLLGENLGELSLSSSTLIVIVILLGGLAILDLSFSSILVTKLGLASMALTWKMCKITWLLHVVSKWYNSSVKRNFIIKQKIPLIENYQSFHGQREHYSSFSVSQYLGPNEKLWKGL